MTDQERAVMQQALEALENTSPLGFNMESDKKFYAAIIALRAALAQQAEPLSNQCGETCERAKLCAVCASKLAEPVEPVQEPAGYWDGKFKFGASILYEVPQQSLFGFKYCNEPLYTAPLQRKSVEGEKK